MIENKLGLTTSAELAREEERISKKKAIDLFGGLLIKDKKEETYNPRPVYKRFDD